MSEESKFEVYQEHLLDILKTVFDQLELEGSFTCIDKGNKISVKIASADPGRVIGRHGMILESLQLIINRLMFKFDEETPIVFLDIDGYADGDRVPREKNENENNVDSENSRRSRNLRKGGSRHGASESISVEQLEQQARDAAKEVKRWGEPITLPEMNPHDRRIVHITLKNDPEIITESIGEGKIKKVVVALKKSEE